jgi:predicted 2-oxoglutarate/Fe(II)-dependent dioxygenase YbiX
MQEYTIGGVGVGMSPEQFDRSESYQNFFELTGSSIDNIYRIPDLITSQDAEDLIKVCDSSDPIAETGQWSGMIWEDERIDNIFSQYEKLITETFQKHFDVKCKLVSGPYVVKWQESDSMGLHVDDLSENNSQFHLSGIIYLNDDYSGGGLSFPTQGVSLLPKKYEMIIFPGNLHYAHEVLEITSGSRYTLPVWATIQ